MQKVYFLAFLFYSIFSFAGIGNDEKTPVEVQKEFKGILKYVEYTPFDTTYYKVYVSNGKIRVDSFLGKDDENNAEKIMIYDLKNNKVLALKPSEQIYKTFDADDTQNFKIDGCDVIQNKRNHKIINGYNCIQYRIKNVAENTDVTYWIPEEDFPFYYKMVSMKHSMQRVHKYFFMLPNYKVAFPLQTTERSLLREEKSSYQVTEIDEIAVSESVFEVPKNYILNK